METIIERDEMVDYIIEFEAARMTQNDIKALLKGIYFEHSDEFILMMYKKFKNLEEIINEPVEQEVR